MTHHDQEQQQQTSMKKKQIQYWKDGRKKTRVVTLPMDCTTNSQNTKTETCSSKISMLTGYRTA